MSALMEMKRDEMMSMGRYEKMCVHTREPKRLTHQHQVHGGIQADGTTHRNLVLVLGECLESKMRYNMNNSFHPLNAKRRVQQATKRGKKWAGGNEFLTEDFEVGEI